MKIAHGLPDNSKTEQEKLIQQGWNPLKEPDSFLTAVVLSIPLMFLNAWAGVFIIKSVSTLTFAEFGLTKDGFVASIGIIQVILFFLTIVVHELLHLVCIPHFLKSKKTYIGFTFFGGYVSSEEQLSKARFALISLCPFLALSVLLPLGLGMMGWLTPTLKFLIIFNAISSCVDILGLLLVLTQIPKNSVIKNNGTKTFWKAGKGMQV
ncbi:DUF3267 domain-containing protein [Halobacillus mangrovi]|uniref:DUF3267 domain-containing protein n=1 Tax=Halobacillus mangrovi TaxID=402384 RepID=A0A1W5ZV56_9BACI|nr:DUF3267 domain-containing protein [Halobacillus mangrovi]ARI77159.1 hypothetical protein HM131_10055 [Halobacillus mangrovi]